MDEQIKTQWRLMTPSTWWTLPLTSAQVDEQIIREHVRELMPNADSVSAIRHELETSLREQAARARSNRGIALLLAEELVPGIRLGGSLLISHLALLDPTLERLRSVAAASGPESMLAFDAIAGPGLRALSHSLERTANAELVSLRADYFVAATGVPGAYLLSFSVPVTPAWESAALELTDSIARGFHLADQQDISRQRTRRR